MLRLSSGDDTPKLQGRLNLNPLSHIDPIGFMLLIVAGFGWGRPVQIDSRNFDGKYSLSKAEAIVAAAGPLMNFCLAFIFMIIAYVCYSRTDILNGLSANANIVLYTVLIVEEEISSVNTILSPFFIVFLSSSIYNAISRPLFALIISFVV